MYLFFIQRIHFSRMHLDSLNFSCYRECQLGGFCDQSGVEIDQKLSGLSGLLRNVHIVQNSWQGIYRYNKTKMHLIANIINYLEDERVLLFFLYFLKNTLTNSFTLILIDTIPYSVRIPMVFRWLFTFFFLFPMCYPGSLYNTFDSCFDF